VGGGLLAVRGFIRVPRSRIQPSPHRVLPKHHKWLCYDGWRDTESGFNPHLVESLPNWLVRLCLSHKPGMLFVKALLGHVIQCLTVGSLARE
jgi:hypothetical protein